MSLNTEAPLKIKYFNQPEVKELWHSTFNAIPAKVFSEQLDELYEKTRKLTSPIIENLLAHSKPIEYPLSIEEITP